MEKFFKFLKAGGAEEAIKIDAKTVVTAAWTVYKCQFGCERYGKTSRCPPHTPTWRQTQEMIDCYSYGILFRCTTMAVVSPLAVKAARELFLDQYYKVIAFGSGPCKRCKCCSPEHCSFPAQSIPSMEACGIDVFATARANGFSISTLRSTDEPQNHFGLLLVE